MPNCLCVFVMYLFSLFSYTVHVLAKAYICVFCRVGLVESKIRILVGNLEKIPQIRLARANPTMFAVATERYATYMLEIFKCTR